MQEISNSFTLSIDKLTSLSFLFLPFLKGRDTHKVHGLPKNYLNSKQIDSASLCEQKNECMFCLESLRKKTYMTKCWLTVCNVSPTYS